MGAFGVGENGFDVLVEEFDGGGVLTADEKTFDLVLEGGEGERGESLGLLAEVLGKGDA